MPCACSNGKTTLLYACSGVANTGYLADQVARTLHKEGVGKMTCLAALGARDSGFIESARGAGRNVVIDGCPIGCGKRIFETLAIPFERHMMTAYNVEKGKTVITGEIITNVTSLVKESICNGK
jgi:uncharacterized metal-binding protein